MQASDRLRQTGYAIVTILLLMALFFVLVGDGWTAGAFGAVSVALIAALEWIRARGFRSFSRNGVSLPRS